MITAEEEATIANSLREISTRPAEDHGRGREYDHQQSFPFLTILSQQQQALVYLTRYQEKMRLEQKAGR